MTDLSAWPTLLLTAGLGTRLAPLSDVRAKPAIPVAGTPLVVRILRWLRAAGIRRVVLNLHHRPETITRIVGDGSPWDIEVRYSWEPQLMGSAGGPSRALPLLDAERFFIVNGDTLTDCRLDSLAERHLASRALVTMAVVPGDVARYGGVVVDAADRVTGFARAVARVAPAHRTSSLVHRDAPIAPHDHVLHFIGVQAVESGALAGVADDRPSDTVRTLYPRLMAADAGAIAAFRSAATFLDVGTPRDYFETATAVARAEGTVLDRGERVHVAPGAQVSETIIWDDVTIASGARLHRCIVADGVRVGPGAYEEQVLVATPGGGVQVSRF
jgi:NDP-sugar pyrophosphorylase family protein